MCIRIFFRAGCVERGMGEASGKSSGTESRMGEERKICREEKLTVKVMWKNVRKICTREKQIAQKRTANKNYRCIRKVCGVDDVRTKGAKEVYWRKKEEAIRKLEGLYLYIMQW